jgi:membrane protein DedA with SNARE-associated domain
MAVLLARLVPTLRTLISLPAGMARMPLAPFLIYSAIGTALWTGLLAASGFWLQESYTLVADPVDRISKIIIGLIVLIYVWRLLAGGWLGDRVRDWLRPCAATSTPCILRRAIRECRGTPRRWC